MLYEVITERNEVIIDRETFIEPEHIDEIVDSVITSYSIHYTKLYEEKAGKVLPVLISVYTDKSFDFIIKTPPAAVQLLEVAKLT